MNGSDSANNVGVRVGDGEGGVIVGTGEGVEMVRVTVGEAGGCVDVLIAWVGDGRLCCEHPTSRLNTNNQIAFLIIMLRSPFIICKDTNN